MFKKTFFIIFLVILAGISGIVAERYLFPYLATTSFFSHYSFLKQANQNVTVINKTEKVYIKEDSSLTKITDPIVATIVNIVSYPNDVDNKNNF